MLVRVKPVWVSAAGAFVAAVLLVGCSAEAPASVGSSHYRSEAFEGSAAVQTAIRTAPVAVWFERDNGQLVMIASGPVNAYTVPVSFTAGTIVPDRNHIIGTAEGCFGESASCIVEGWLSRFVTGRMTYRADKSTLNLTEGGTRVTFRRG